ncbi:unnamed protein product [Ambrosiozyma monospora]|uniref:Unnamed protein product n=1 Tax=Ambrosiozyma monospora TaxID=43982 RepID=A0ACB5U223_AMBMO|nr:unnamed protein product [Ambrosiozyma monospora]
MTTGESQQDQSVLETRIWIDGCFDFAHHGHAGAMLQARQHGKELYVGVHSDEEILENKGPVVMTLKERIAAVDGCRWCTKSIPSAPYVTDPVVMNQNRCKYVVHGDDITTDANGEDCYKTMKDLRRFIVVKRTPNISTTDLVGRMLLYSKEHHIPPITSKDWDAYTSKKSTDHPILGQDAVERYKMYATCEDGLHPGVAVFVYTKDQEQLHTLVSPDSNLWSADKPVFYIDGGFDLFNPGHITALKVLREKADKANALVLVGLNDDSDVNRYKELNYPIMNMFERSLCVLQSKYIDGIVLGAPYAPTSKFINLIPNKVLKVFHGPTPEDHDPYTEIKKVGLFEQLGPHEFDSITTKDIVNRVLKNREAYEERQRRKGWKAEVEKKIKDTEEAQKPAN